MKRGRPTKVETPFKIIIHNNGGRRYASTKVAILSPNGKKVFRHKHWGVIDENDKFTPNQTFLMTPSDERDKLMFPDNIDLTSIAGVTNVKVDTPLFEPGYKDRQFGPTWFLDKVADVTGTKADLLKVFNGNEELVREILTLAYFPFVDNLSYSHLSQWQEEVRSPTRISLTSKRITLLTQAITAQNRLDFFKCRAARVDKEEYCAVDSTSISTYGFNLVDIRWGRNKEHLPLQQFVEVVVYSLTSHMPIFYIELPGNIPDCVTIEMILHKLEEAGFHNLVIITDRGYDSLKNIELYISKRQKVITCVKTGQGDVFKKIQKIDLSQGIPSGMEYDPDTEIYYKQYNCKHTVKDSNGEEIESDNLRVNIFFSVQGRANMLRNYQNEVSNQTEIAEKLIKENKDVKKSLSTQLNLLELEIKDKKLLSYTIKEKPRQKLLATAGFFASKTIGLEITPLEAMCNYGMRDEQEKCFQLKKSPLHQDRIRAWTETSKHGRTFICFVGLILASYVRHIWIKDDYLKKKYGSTEDILGQMRTIRCFEHDDQITFITPFIGDQVEICKAFGFELPQMPQLSESINS